LATHLSFQKSGGLSVTAPEASRGMQAPSNEITVAHWARAQKWPLLVTAVLVVVLYAVNFAKLGSDWWSDENYSHGFIVPVVFFWMLWQRREALANSRVVPRPWALVIVVLALVQLAAGTWGAENFVAHSSLLLLLCGITLYLFGSEVLRLVAFPIGWLLFMIPVPAIILYAITFPLQLLASRLALDVLDLLRVPALREGNVLYLANFTAGVAEACSGIRSLISILAFAVLIGHLLSMSLRSRWILAIAAVTVALSMNAARVAGTGLVGNYLGARWAEGFFHTFSGWLLFLGCLGIIGGVVYTLRVFERHGNAQGAS
jgi:exosortase